MNLLGLGGGYQIKKASEGHDLIIVIHSDGHEVWDPKGFQEFGLLHSPVNGWVFPDRASTSILRWADPYGMPYEHSRAYVISRETPNPLEVPEIINRAVTAAISRGNEGNVNKDLQLEKRGGSAAGDWYFYAMLGVFLVTFFFGTVLAPSPIINIDSEALAEQQEVQGEVDTEAPPPPARNGGSGGDGGDSGAPRAGNDGGPGGAGQPGPESVGGAVVPPIVGDNQSPPDAEGGGSVPGQGGP